MRKRRNLCVYLSAFSTASAPVLSSVLMITGSAVMPSSVKAAETLCPRIVPPLTDCVTVVGCSRTASPKSLYCTFDRPEQFGVRVRCIGTDNGPRPHADSANRHIPAVRGHTSRQGPPAQRQSPARRPANRFTVRYNAPPTDNSASAAAYPMYSARKASFAVGEQFVLLAVEHGGLARSHLHDGPAVTGHSHRRRKIRCRPRRSRASIPAVARGTAHRSETGLIRFRVRFGYRVFKRQS